MLKGNDLLKNFKNGRLDDNDCEADCDCVLCHISNYLQSQLKEGITLNFALIVHTRNEGEQHGPVLYASQTPADKMIPILMHVIENVVGKEETKPDDAKLH